jgi:hypothetical protein
MCKKAELALERKVDPIARGKGCWVGSGDDNGALDKVVMAYDPDVHVAIVFEVMASTVFGEVFRGRQ